jgi:hypothetical protein
VIVRLLPEEQRVASPVDQHQDVLAFLQPGRHLVEILHRLHRLPVDFSDHVTPHHPCLLCAAVWLDCCDHYALTLPLDPKLLGCVSIEILDGHPSEGIVRLTGLRLGGLCGIRLPPIITVKSFSWPSRITRMVTFVPTAVFVTCLWSATESSTGKP